MREIKFRGKDLKGEHWWYGSLAYFPDSQTYHIIPCGSCKNGEVICDFVEVQKDTIGQFTGILDEDDNEIFEGDLVDVVKEEERWMGKDITIQRGPVKYIPKAMTFRIGNVGYLAPYHREYDVKVVGNIHDNPELYERDKVQR